MSGAITIRRIDPRLHEALRRRASRAGRSVESEVRAILAGACLPADEAWALGARERARARSAGQTRTDSVDLIRAARDGR